MALDATLCVSGEISVVIHGSHVKRIIMERLRVSRKLCGAVAPGVRVVAWHFASDSVPEFVSLYLARPCMYIPVCAVAALRRYSRVWWILLKMRGMPTQVVPSFSLCSVQRLSPDLTTRASVPRRQCKGGNAQRDDTQRGAWTGCQGARLCSC